MPGDRPGCADLLRQVVRVDGTWGAVELSRDGGRVYLGHTTGGGQGAPGRSRLAVLDRTAGSELLEVDLGAHGQVTDIWPSHEGTRIWAATESDGRVFTVESTTGEVLMTWVIGTDSPQRGTISPDDRYLYVTNRDAGTLTLIDRVTTGAKTVELGAGLSGLARAPGGDEVWVANREMDRLTVVSARDGVIRARLPSGGMAPVDVAFHPAGGEVWVANYWSQELAVFDAGTRRLSRVVSLPGRPVALRFSPSGQVAYAGLGQGGLLRVRTGDGTVVDSVPEGQELPGRLAAARAARTACAGGG